MHRIPNDIALIVYRMIHADIMQRCISRIDDLRDNVGKTFNYRDLGNGHENRRVCSVYEHRVITTRGTIPAIYVYSSGLNSPLAFK
jgi:hypothetical protein